MITLCIFCFNMSHRGEVEQNLYEEDAFTFEIQIPGHEKVRYWALQLTLYKGCGVLGYWFWFANG